MSYLCRGFLVFAILVTGIHDGVAQSVVPRQKKLLGDIEIINAGVDTCSLNDSERHSLFADFALPINVNERVVIRDGMFWDIYANISANGDINGRITSFIQGTLDQWALGLDGSGTAIINVRVPITGRNRRGRFRRFGQINATIQVAISDQASLESTCADGQHGDPGIVTSEPSVTVRILSLCSNYTGPLSIFPRIRSAVQAKMRAAFRSNINQQIQDGVADYQRKKEDLINRLIAKLPEGCFCQVSNIIASNSREPVTR